MKLRLYQVDAFAERHIPWLFAQNINPFLAKTIHAENRLLRVNSEALQRKVSK